MSARDWIYRRLTGALVDTERASAELDAYRDEIRTAAFLEAADEVDVDDNCDCGGCDSCVMQAAATRLREKAGDKSRREAGATPAQLRAYANAIRRQDAARLRDERRRFLSRAIFCDGIQHAADRLTQWADEDAPARATCDTPGEGT